MAYNGLGVLIRQTSRYIDENPSEVVVLRSTGTADGAGGTVAGTEAPVGPAQTMRLVPSGIMNEMEIRTVDGEVLKTAYSILAMPDADLKDGDAFMLDDVRYEVASCVGIGGYELRAEAVRRG